MLDDMLRLLSGKSTEVLLRNSIISDKKKAIYIYGFELFYSTAFCIISILTLGTVFHYLDLAVTFLLYFMPVRVAAGGYHAKSYGRCFILTNSVAVICIFFSKLLWNVSEGEIILWIIFGVSFWYIWKEAPVVTKKHPLKADRILKNRRYAHIILIVETLVLLTARLVLKNCMVYTSIVTTFAVAIMIMVVRKGGGEG